MATSRRDVSLVIRAKDEATKAFEAAADALQSLLSVNDKVGASATKTGNRLEELAAIALTIDKSFSKITGSADSAAAAFERQQASLAESKAQLAALKVQADAAAASMARLNSPDAIVNAGRDQSGRIKQLAFVSEQYDRLTAQQGKLQASIASQEAGLDGQRSSLQQIGSTAIAAAEAQERLAAEIANETVAMQKAAAAAEHLSDVQKRINQLTGVDRVSGSASASAEILAQVAAHDELIQRLKAEQQAKTELQQIDEAQRRAATLLPGDSTSGKSARESAAAFMDAETKSAADLAKQLKATETAEEQMAAAAIKLRAALDPMATIQDNLNRELAEANKLYKAGKISAAEYDGAIKLLNGNAKTAGERINNGKPTLFGLSPYAVQNFSFQINDVVTQLASGTSLTQTLAQQGGQLLQLFPKVGAGIAAAFTSPPILAVVAAVTALTLGLNEAQKQATVLREFQGLLNSSADAATYQAASLRATAEELDRYGLSAKEAVAIVRSFVKDGINPARLEEFGRAAKDMADVLGIDVKQAAEQLGDAFSAGYDAVKKLDDATDAYTATQLDHIKTLFEEGKANEARAYAFNAYSDRMAKGAQDMRGPWKDAVRELGNAWREFMTLLANSAIVKNMGLGLEGLARGVTGVLRAINGTRELADVMRDIAVTQKTIDDRAKSGRGPGQFQEMLDRFKAEAAALKAAAPKNDADTRAADERQKKADAEVRAADEKKLAAAKVLTNEQRIQAAYQDALLEAQNKGASVAAATASASIAASIERKKIEKEITEERKKQTREWSQDLANSSNDALNDTAKRFEGKSETRNKGDLQTFFKTAGINIDPEMVKWCAAFVNSVLATNGIKGTGSLAAKSFLGFGQEVKSEPKVGDIVILNRGSNPKEGHVGFFQGFDENGNVKVLGGNQSDGVTTQSFPRSSVAGIRRAPSQGDVAKQQVKETEDLERAQANFNERIEEEVERRQQNVASMQAQKGLIGEQLIAEQRKEAVADARQRLEQQFEKINVDRAARDLTEIKLTDEQKKKVEQLTAAEFDLAHARDVASARRTVVEDPVNDLATQQAYLEQQIDLLQQMGDIPGVGVLQTQLADVNLKLADAQRNMIAFWESVLTGANGGPEAFGMTAAAVQNLIDKTGQAIIQSQSLGSQFLSTGREINESLASGAAGAFDQLAESIANGANVFTSLRDAFLQFAADFLRQIAQMIIKQAIFNAIGGATGDGSGGLGGKIAGAIGSIFHNGGIAGSSSAPTRMIDAGWYQNAMRYHQGGIAGLRPGEVPAILKRGEEVLTQDDPRHVGNGGGGGGDMNLKNVIVFDPADVLSKALATKAGEKVLFTWVSANRGALGIPG